MNTAKDVLNSLTPPSKKGDGGISLTEELAALEQKKLRRSLRDVEQVEGARIYIAGKALLNFSSNNYLGLARHPQVLEAVRQVLEHWGVGATASRLISGNQIIHRDLELALAAFLKREAALVFPAGYMANAGLLTALAGAGDAIILDRLCHEHPPLPRDLSSLHRCRRPLGPLATCTGRR